MMDEFKKLMKDKGKKMDPEQKKAKIDVLRELRGMANDTLSSEIPSLKKVTVAAPTQEGLEEGLEKAEDIIGDEAMASEDEEEMAADSAMDMDQESEAYKKIWELANSLSDEEKQKLLAKLV